MVRMESAEKLIDHTMSWSAQQPLFTQLTLTHYGLIRIILSNNTPSRDSPFMTEELLELMETTLPPSRCMAAWNEEDVRVLTS